MLEYQFSGRGLKSDNSNCWKCLDGNFSISISQTVLCIMFCVSYSVIHRFYISCAINFTLQGTTKPTAPSRGRPRSAPARTGAPLHRAHRWSTPAISDPLTINILTYHNHIADFKPLSQLWVLEVPTRCRLWFLGHPLREICPDHHSLSTGSEDRGGGSEAGGAHLDSDQCLCPS